MQPTQNTPTTPEPKKSFWQKLFGGGKAASPDPVSQPPTETPTSTSDNTLDSSSTMSNPTPPVADWSAPATPPQATEPTVDPLPSWRDTSAAAETPAEVPIPPSDPMVTPVQQPPEPAVSEPTVGFKPINVPEIPPMKQDWSSDPTPAEQPDTAPASDRPSITPPNR